MGDSKADFNKNFDSLSVRLSPDVTAATAEITAWRREIHRSPGLSFRETETQKLVLKTLASFGIEGRPVAGTGVTAEIVGDAPGKVLLLRGDMDALPIQEAADVPWKSRTDGVMHACGHDAHTAILLGAAKILSSRRLRRGTVKLMFQPAEEGGGGAEAMLDAGVLDAPRVDAAVGFHVWTGYEIGTVSIPEGPVTAGVDGFRIIVTGKGTHAAAPENGVDPVLAAAHIVTGAQSLVTRRIRAMDPAVLSFTALRGGSAFNIIPESVEILGTLRIFDAAVRMRIRAELEAFVSRTAEAFGARSTFEVFTETVPMHAAPETVAVARRAAEAVVGPAGLLKTDPLMVGEDFGEVTARVPGAFVMLGCRNPTEGAVYPHHHPLFTIDERVLPIGVDIAVRLAERYLSASGPAGDGNGGDER